MNKDRQHIEHGIEHETVFSYEHNKRIFNCRMSYFTQLPQFGDWMKYSAFRCAVS